MHDDWNFHETEKEEFEPHARPESRRISFCPTCGRPFVRGTGVLSKACILAGKAGKSPSSDPDCKEYCRESCLPGTLA